MFNRGDWVNLNETRSNLGGKNPRGFYYDPRKPVFYQGMPVTNTVFFRPKIIRHPSIFNKPHSLSSAPYAVYKMGDKNFYIPTRATNRGYEIKKKYQGKKKTLAITKTVEKWNHPSGKNNEATINRDNKKIEIDGDPEKKTVTIEASMDVVLEIAGEIKEIIEKNIMKESDVFKNNQDDKKTTSYSYKFESDILEKLIKGEHFVSEEGSKKIVSLIEEKKKKFGSRDNNDDDDDKYDGPIFTYNYVNYGPYGSRGTNRWFM